MNKFQQIIQTTIGILVFTLLLASLPAQAQAHRPEAGDVDGVTLIPNVSTSYAYYQELTENNPVHVYQVQGRAGEQFHAGINIPQLTGLEEYGVSIALLGPDLPTVDLRELPIGLLQQSGTPALVETLSRQFQDGKVYGQIIASSVSESFYEPFTQTDYWGRQSLDLDLPTDQPYYLLVWNPAGQAGKYVMDTGYKEVFGPGDAFRFPVWWLNTRLYFEQGPAIFGSLAAVLAGFALLMVWRRRIRLPQPAPATAFAGD